MKKHILFITNGVPLGCATTALITYARLCNGEKFTVSGVCLYGEGSHKNEFSRAVDAYYFVKSDLESVKVIAKQKNVSCILLNGVLYEPEPRYPRIIDLLRWCKKNNIRTVSLEHFVRHDETVDSLVSVRLFVSKTTLLKYELSAQNKHTRSYIYNPVQSIRTKDTAHKTFIIGRIGRASMDKWDDLLIKATPFIVEKIPQARFLVRSIPEELKKNILPEIYNRFTFLPETTNFGLIRKTISTCDVLVQTSKIGETFGCAIAEGMALGKPIIVNSTDFRKKYPYDRDNAQIELVEDGVNGFVANTPHEIAECVYALYASPELRISMGTAGRKKAQIFFDPITQTRKLEKWLIGKPKKIDTPLTLEEYRNVVPHESRTVMTRAWLQYYLERFAHKILPTRITSDRE